MKFDPLKDNFSIPKAEEQILKFWDTHNVFHKAHEMAQDRPHFVFYEGPPTANGKPGIHHVISRTVKDLFCRYKAMKGFRVDRKAGWDTHGLPVEIEVEKELKLTSKPQVVEYGITKFNDKCKESVFRYLNDWSDLTRRIGYWLDLDDAYVTLRNEYIETVWWILKNFFDRNLIYKGYKTIPYCPRCGTGLSSHEVAQGYDLVKDPSVYVKVKAADDDFAYLVWTTTPWTLPSNAALCMKADADYVLVEYQGEKLVLAEALVWKTFGGEAEVKIIDRYKGEDFLKRKYAPLFDTFKDEIDKAFFVINADFVTLEDGTGIVHIAPGFGQDDYDVGQEYGLPVFQAIEANGYFKDFAGPYKGMFIKDADPIIMEDLKKAGKLYKKELYEHNYPFCWRCDSPLIYIAQPSWYLKTTQFKDQLIKNNNDINWYPDDIRTGRMLNWLENNVDWSLSRERFWGTPIPIWICEDSKCGKQRAVGSLEQLRQEAQNLPDEIDLHKPMMDEVRLTCECGGTMNRIPEVVDVWFDSGAMPYAQWHYPFENKDEFERKYPADFISEAVDQTRGWFYSLLAISTLLFDKAPFKNVVVLEFVLDQEGKKMSKHKGNVVDPFETVDKYGADPVRWYLVSASNPWLPTRFGYEGLGEVIRKFFDTMRNTYSFFAIYANIDNISERAEAEGVTARAFLEKKAGEPQRFDRWIISKYNSLVKDVTESFDGYEITKPVRAIQHFVIEELSNWYVRNTRRRFWAKADDPSKMRAYLTLYDVLAGVCHLAAPVAPFLTELVWTQLMGENRQKYGLPLSVHMSDFPVTDESLIDEKLEETMDIAEQIVSLGRAARSRKNIKVRQPLSRLMIKLPNWVGLERLEGYLDIIKSELNIKEIAVAEDVANYVSYSAKLNFKTAGPKLGVNAKAAAACVAELDSEGVKRFLDTKTLTLQVDSKKIELAEDEVEVSKSEKEGFAVESEGALSIALETRLTDDLIDEGFARELVNKIQNMRKSSGFEVTDQIEILLHSSDRLLAAARKHDEFIRRETLAKQIKYLAEGSFEGCREWNINGVNAAIAVSKRDT
ncbi:MAG: isoleucine--tRNA ligase [Candidatus Zixiibacteriota bacterium]|nr:MAG: isoleucine--tRNA ligase [candidate division Zixibacteria bacterium]